MCALPTPECSTPPSLLNNGVKVNESDMPDIFQHSRKPQVLRVQPAAPVAAASLEHQLEHSRLFGSGSPVHHLTTSEELGRLGISSVRQLQRALQSKCIQAIRPQGLHHVFKRLDRGQTGFLNLADLQAAVERFNLSAPDELVAQLLLALDSDHDGLLSLSEFVAGLGPDATQLRAEAVPISTRRHYHRNLKFNHPLHNMIPQDGWSSDSPGRRG